LSTTSTRREGVFGGYVAAVVVPERLGHPHAGGGQSRGAGGQRTGIVQVAATADTGEPAAVSKRVRATR
jgi:hypothetical protein